MSGRDEERRILEDTDAISATGLLVKVGNAFRRVVGGWRAPARHDHDETDAAEAKAQAAVTDALERGREKAGV